MTLRAAELSNFQEYWRAGQLGDAASASLIEAMGKRSIWEQYGWFRVFVSLQEAFVEAHP
jgi:hypothetical protein